MDENKKKLLEIGAEIREVIDKKQKAMALTFVEDTHTYFIKNNEGKSTRLTWYR